MIGLISLRGKGFDNAGKPFFPGMLLALKDRTCDYKAYQAQPAPPPDGPTLRSLLRFLRDIFFRRQYCGDPGEPRCGFALSSSN